jgi:hypothetical protein
MQKIVFLERHFSYDHKNLFLILENIEINKPNEKNKVWGQPALAKNRNSYFPLP